YFKRRGALEAQGRTKLSSDDILALLCAAGGSRYVSELKDTPSQWATRVPGVGAIGIAAALRNGTVKARLVRREANGPAAPRAPSQRPRAGASKRPPEQPVRPRSIAPRA